MPERLLEHPNRPHAAAAKRFCEARLPRNRVLGLKNHAGVDSELLRFVRKEGKPLREVVKPVLFFLAHNTTVTTLLGIESPVAFEAKMRKSCSTPRSKPVSTISESVVVTCQTPQSSVCWPCKVRFRRCTL